MLGGVVGLVFDGTALSIITTGMLVYLWGALFGLIFLIAVLVALGVTMLVREFGWHG